MRSRTYPISLRARARQPGGEVVQRRLEAPGEALGDAALLPLPRFRVAAQAHLQAVLGQFPDQPHRAARLRPDGHRLGRVERPLRLPADHQVAVAFPPQPGQPVLRRHAAVHHHQGAVRRAQRPQHLRQRAALGDVAGEHPRAADEAARVQRQPQRQQRTVAALLLRAPARRLRHRRRATLEERVRQVVQRHRRRQAEQPRRPLEQPVLDGVAVRQQRVRRPAQPHRPHRLEVRVQQFPQGAALRQPAPRLPLRRRMRHAPDDVAHGRRQQPRTQPQLRQQLAQPQPVHRPQRRVLHADRARARQFQRVHVHAPQVRRRVRRGRRRLAGGQPRRDPLRLRLHLRRQSSGSSICPASSSSTRWQSSGQRSRGSSKWRPRLSSVRWRTLAVETTPT